MTLLWRYWLKRAPSSGRAPKQKTKNLYTDIFSFFSIGTLTKGFVFFGIFDFFPWKNIYQQNICFSTIAISIKCSLIVLCKRLMKLLTFCLKMKAAPRLDFHSFHPYVLMTKGKFCHPAKDPTTITLW